MAGGRLALWRSTRSRPRACSSHRPPRARYGAYQRRRHPRDGRGLPAADLRIAASDDPSSAGRARVAASLTRKRRKPRVGAYRTPRHVVATADATFVLRLLVPAAGLVGGQASVARARACLRRCGPLDWRGSARLRGPSVELARTTLSAPWPVAAAAGVRTSKLASALFSIRAAIAPAPVRSTWAGLAVAATVAVLLPLAAMRAQEKEPEKIYKVGGDVTCAQAHP